MSNLELAQATQLLAQGRSLVKPRTDDEEVAVGVKRLENFLGSDEGKKSLNLLTASGLSYVLAREESRSIWGADDFYILDGGGIFRETRLRMILEGPRPVSSIRLEAKGYAEMLYIIVRNHRDFEHRRESGAYPKRTPIKASKLVPAIRRELKELAARVIAAESAKP